MGKTTGFMEYGRELAQRRPVTERVNDWFEIYVDFPEDTAAAAGRALHGLRRALLPHRMPGQQLIPDWNDLVYRGRWKEAVRQFTPPITFLNSRGGFVPRLVKLHVCWASTSRR